MSLSSLVTSVIPFAPLCLFITFGRLKSGKYEVFVQPWELLIFSAAAHIISPFNFKGLIMGKRKEKSGHEK